MIKQLAERFYDRVSPVARRTKNLERMLTEQMYYFEKNRNLEDVKRSEILEEIRCQKDVLDVICSEFEKNANNLKTDIEKLQMNVGIIYDLLGVCNANNVINNTEVPKSEKDYINMQREHYNNPAYAPEDIVGQYEWHEEYPYETFLLYRNGDIRKPLFETTGDKVALDFACGPGRMVKRMRKIFAKVDGCDISERMIEEARKRVPDTDFYITNGNDLGKVPLNSYDLVYCTISMQHIASYQIRSEILRNMNKVLKESGKVVLQMAYNANCPYVFEKKRLILNGNEIRVYGKIPMAAYFSNDYGAKTTNGGYDLGIGREDLEAIRIDFSHFFKNVSIWFSNVSKYYDNLEGKKHGIYWATDWIYICGERG